jgi:ribonuclease Z
MDVVLLGTGSPIPDATRAGPATLVRAGGRQLLVDCGRGVLMRLAAAGAFPPQIDAVLLTHLHSDHTTDFNDVVTMRWAMAQVELPLRVYGPPGTAEYVDRVLAMLAHDIGYRLAHHDDLQWEPRCEVTEVLDGVVMDDTGLRVIAAPTDHRPVAPTVGYRFEHDGRSAVIAGDTVPCEGLDRLCAGADVYVQTVIRRVLVERLPVPRLQDIIDYHSSTEDAARTAATGHVGRLVYTHMVPPVAPGTEGDWIADAAPHYDGEVILGNDLQVITV